MKKILFLILEYIAIKIVLILLFAVNWKSSDIFQGYYCGTKYKEYDCDLVKYLYDSPFASISDKIAIILLIITVIVYFIRVKIRKISVIVEINENNKK